MTTLARSTAEYIAALVDNAPPLTPGQQDRLRELLCVQQPLLRRTVPAVARPRQHEICTVDGCDRPHKAAGLCRGHYQRQLAHGDPGPVEIRRYGGGTCRTDGCTAPAHSLGTCKRHYDRQRRAAP